MLGHGLRASDIMHCFIEIPNERYPLLRGEKDCFAINLEPSDAPVSFFEESDDSSILSVTLNELNVVANNLISDIYAWTDSNIGLRIHCLLSGCDGKVFGIEYDLQKNWEDIYEKFDLPDLSKLFDSQVAKEGADQIAKPSTAYSILNLIDRKH